MKMDRRKFFFVIGQFGDLAAIYFEAFLLLVGSIVAVYVMSLGCCRSYLAENLVLLFGLLVFFYKLKEGWIKWGGQVRKNGY
jgi:hypothetical protein